MVAKYYWRFIYNKFEGYISLMSQKINQNQAENKIAFFVKATTAKGATGGAFTHINNLNTKIYDLSDNYDASTQRFTAPIDGVYSFVGNIGAANNSTRIFSSIYVNGSEFARATNGTLVGDSNTSQVVLQINLTKGSYVQLYGWRANNGNFEYSTINGHGSLTLAGYLVTVV